MNPKEILLIARFFQLKFLKFPKMEDAYIKATKFLKALICDFRRIDAEIQSVLTKKMNFPPFEHHVYITEWFQDLSLRAKNFPQLSIVFRLSRDSEKFFLLATALLNNWKELFQWLKSPSTLLKR